MTRQIHLIFKTHLDVGFTDFAGAVTQNYFKRYIPAALRVAQELRDSSSPERFIWTTGSWLIYEYLEQASSEERHEMEQAILAGDIAWHGLPFTTHTELMDADLFRFGLSLSKSLDTRFGRKTIAAKMTDVPGHTRAMIPLLVEAGITFLHIGVNPGSTVPGVPGLFRWSEPGGAEVMVMYESGYGSAFQIPGLDHSLAFGHTMDNMGPQNTEQVLDVYRGVRAQFSDAQVFASSLSAFALELEAVRHTLPLLREEIGDTWIHGVGSDPIKVSRFRELLRLRKEWLVQGKIDQDNEQFRRFNRWLLMVPEHTWGMDEKTFLGDHENYSAEKFAAARNRPNFKMFESSWVEKRAYPQRALNALEDTPLGAEARQRLESIRPQKPDLSRWHPITTWPKLETETLVCEFEPQQGILNHLKNFSTGCSWVDESCTFSKFTYQSFSVADYDAFFNSYIIPQQRHGWAEEDFCKPGLTAEESESTVISPIVNTVFHQSDSASESLLFHLGFDNKNTEKYGLPANIYLRYTLPIDQPAIKIDLQWFNKRASRLPGAYWFSFQPLAHPGAQWVIEKLGREISPLDIVENGNRHLHASGSYVACRIPNSSLVFSSLDAPLVAPGQRSILNFNNAQPDMDGGIHFCLLNNLWGTNFPMWFEEDCRFRFELKLDHGGKDVPE